MLLRSLLLPITLLATVVACGGAQLGGATEATGAPAPARLDVNDQGQIELVDARGFHDGDWVSLVPSAWPATEPDRPIIGLGRIHVAEGAPLLTIWTTRQADGLEAMGAVRTDGPVALAQSKLLVDVLSNDEGTVMLGAGDDAGVTVGDVYYILNAGFDDPRPGTAIGAIVRVTDTAESTSLARIEHASVPIAAGQLARFAQASLDRPPPPVTLVIARTSPGATDGLPAIAAALPSYLSRFAISNIAIVEHAEPIDPRPYAAPRSASDLADEDVEDGFGTVVFGTTDGDTFVYNLSTFGDAPQGDSTVGILPGGLPLPAPDGLESLSEQLVPSFLANVLAQRGDHAQAVYLLETVLRTTELDPALRYHLREHLALRYASLGQSAQALALMTHDIDEARAHGETYPLLNALSIRAYLDTRAGLYEQQLDDTRAFLDVADSVLPPESLGFERLAYARALASSDAYDDATAELNRVQEFARAQDDEELRRSALLDLVDVMLRQDDETSAQLVVGELLDTARAGEPRDAVGVFLNAAELYQSVNDGQRALGALNEAIRAVEGTDSAALKAAVYMRASDVLTGLDMPEDAWRTLQQAAMLFLDTAQYDYGAIAMVRLGLSQIELALSGVDSMALFQEGRRNLLVGAELSLRLAQTLDAAQALVWLGMLEYNVGSEDGAEVFLTEAWELSWRSGHLETLAFIDAQRAQMAASRGDWDAADEAQQRAQSWIDAGELEMELDPVERPDL